MSAFAVEQDRRIYNLVQTPKRKNGATLQKNALTKHENILSTILIKDDMPYGRFSLYLSSQLMYGATRMLCYQTRSFQKYLFEVLSKVQQHVDESRNESAIAVFADLPQGTISIDMAPQNPKLATNDLYLLDDVDYTFPMKRMIQEIDCSLNFGVLKPEDFENTLMPIIGNNLSPISARLIPSDEQTKRAEKFVEDFLADENNKDFMPEYAGEKRKGKRLDVLQSVDLKDLEANKENIPLTPRKRNRTSPLSETPKKRSRLTLRDKTPFQLPPSEAVTASEIESIPALAAASEFENAPILEIEAATGLHIETALASKVQTVPIPEAEPASEVEAAPASEVEAAPVAEVESVAVEKVSKRKGRKKIDKYTKLTAEVLQARTNNPRIATRESFTMIVQPRYALSKISFITQLAKMGSAKHWASCLLKLYNQHLQVSPFSKNEFEDIATFDTDGMISVIRDVTVRLPEFEATEASKIGLTHTEITEERTHLDENITVPELPVLEINRFHEELQESIIQPPNITADLKENEETIETIGEISSLIQENRKIKDKMYLSTSISTDSPEPGDSLISKDLMAMLEVAFHDKDQVEFNDIIPPECYTKSDAVSAFRYLLEWHKEKVIILRQAEPFAPIWITKYPSSEDSTLSDSS